MHYKLSLLVLPISTHLIHQILPGIPTNSKLHKYTPYGVQPRTLIKSRPHRNSLPCLECGNIMLAGAAVVPPDLESSRLGGRTKGEGAPAARSRPPLPSLSRIRVKNSVSSPRCAAYKVQSRYSVNCVEVGSTARGAYEVLRQ